MHLTDIDSTDWLMEPEVMSKPLPPGYIWKVIVDPTRLDGDPGLFFGAYFRFIDLVHGKNEPCSWPDGIIFENSETGDFIRILNGRIHYPEKHTTLQEIVSQVNVPQKTRGVICITVSTNTTSGFPESP